MPEAARPARPAHPVALDVAYPERLSRLKIFVKWLLVIPHVIVVYVLLLVVAILTFLAWFAILFTGRYPKAFFEFSSGMLRWASNAFAYAMLLRDEYPPFSWEPGEYALSLDIPRADRQSRFRLFIRVFAIIPNQIVLGFVQIGWFVATFIAWWAILFTGRYPRGLFKFNVGVMRWWSRQAAYAYLLRDEYPPYSINADARPGNEVVSAIIGAPIFAAYVAVQVMQFSGIITGASSVTVRDVQAISRDHPRAGAGGVRITLLEFEATPLEYARRNIVTVDVLAEKDGFMPVFFSPVFFTLETCDGESWPVDEYEGDAFNWYWQGGSDLATVYFDVPSGEAVCDLTYFTFAGSITFSFRPSVNLRYSP